MGRARKRTVDEPETKRTLPAVLEVEAEVPSSKVVSRRLASAVLRPSI
jgi:hypothetical protein